MGRQSREKQQQSGMKAYASGGSVKHDDLAADKKLITAEFKKRGLKNGGKCKK